MKYFFLIVAVCLSTLVYALPSDKNEPIHLSADKALYSESRGMTSYAGNVIIRQGTLKIHADNLTVNLSNGRSIDSALATGSPARFEQVVSSDKGLAKGQASKIDYNAVTGIVTLTGNAKLTQNGASFSGNAIRYSLKAGDVEATAGGGKRVELILPPNTATNQEAIRQ